MITVSMQPNLNFCIIVLYPLGVLSTDNIPSADWIRNSGWRTDDFGQGKLGVFRCVVSIDPFGSGHRAGCWTGATVFTQQFSSFGNIQKRRQIGHMHKQVFRAVMRINFFNHKVQSVGHAIRT